MSQTIQRTTTSSTNDFELSTREKTRLTKEGIKQIGDEAKQNAAETFSSFDGSAQSFVNGIQGTLGGLVSSMGPVGVAAGAAGALAIGLISGAIQNGTDQTAAFKQKASELAQAFIDAGKTGEISVDALVEKLKDLATTTDQDTTNLADLFDEVKTAGTNSYKAIAQAYAGNQKGLDQLVKTQQKRLDQLDAERQKTEAGNAGYAHATTELERQADAQTKIVGILRQAQSTAKEATKESDAYAASGAAELQIKKNLLDDVATGYDNVRSSAAQAATAEDGAFDVGTYLANVNAGKQALEQFKSNLSEIRLTPAEWTNFLGLDEKTQEQLASAYASGDSKLQQQIRSSLSDSAGKGGSDATVKFSETFKPEQKDALKIKVDDSDAQSAVDKLTKARTMTLDVALAPGAAAGVVASLQRYVDSHPVTVNARAGKYTP
jgi:cytochrome c551/c552